MRSLTGLERSLVICRWNTDKGLKALVDKDQG